MTLLEHYEWEHNEGRKEGEFIKLIRQIRIKMGKGKEPELIASELEEDLSVVQMICDAIWKNEGVDDEGVFASLNLDLC